MRKVWTMSFAGLLVGCATVSPRENFVQILTQYVGTDATSLPAYSFAFPPAALKESQLPNGNIQRTYLREISQGKCLYAFELTPEEVIVSWHVAEDHGGCQVVP